MSLKFEMIKNNLDDPNLSESFGYFYDNRPPNSGDDDYVNTIPFGSDFLVYWWDKSTNNIFQLTNWGNSPLVWNEFANNQNLLSLINSSGWQINTSRSYSDQSSLGFNASRQPSATNDIQLSVSVTLANTLLTTSTVQIEMSPDNSTWEVIATMANLTEAVSSNTYSANPTVPAGYYYQLTTSGSGTPTLVNLKELSF